MCWSHACKLSTFWYHFYMFISATTTIVIILILLISEITIKSNVTVGKWMIFRRRAMIDETWQKIAEATVAGKLGCSSKVVNIANQLQLKCMPRVHAENMHALHTEFCNLHTKPCKHVCSKMYNN